MFPGTPFLCVCCPWLLSCPSERWCRNGSGLHASNKHIINDHIIINDDNDDNDDDDDDINNQDDTSGEFDLLGDGRHTPKWLRDDRGSIDQKRNHSSLASVGVYGAYVERQPGALSQFRQPHEYGTSFLDHLHL